ncbi:MAG: MFS transporter [Sulfurospirillaceae bacterium]|nr:MFS transporter [Sulfurospirillaceae bacterium]
MKSYIHLLCSNENLLKLSTVQLICYFGAWFSHMAIYTLLIDLEAPIWALSMAAAFTFLPSMILAPISGAIIDKVDTKTFMLLLTATEIISVFCLLFINSLDYLWVLLALIFVRMGIGSIYFQTEMSLLPKLLSKDELKLANEIHSIIWSTSYALGMAIAGFYVHYFGVKSAFVADIVLYCVGYFLLTKIAIPSLIITNGVHVWQMMKDGFAYLKSNPKIFHLIFLHASVGLTAYDALIALLAKNPYKEILSVPLVIGFLNASRAIALIFGQLLWGRFINNGTLFWLLFAQGIGIGVWGLMQENFYISLIGMFCAGLFTTTLWSYTYTLLQHQTSRDFYGRVIAYNDMFFMAISTLTSFGIGFLYTHTISLSNITLSIAWAFIAVSFYWLWIKKRYM